MKKLIYTLIFSLLLIGFFHPVFAITQDLGRHLKTGEIILQTHNIPKTNLFSYTYPDFPFINHHWLPEVFYFLSFQKIGLNGLLVLNTALIFVSFGLILFAIKKTSSLALLFCSLLYIPILFERTDVRPEFFSFLFLSLFIVILYKFREKYTRLIFLLPLIELLWVNTHIYFPIGIFLIGIFLIDAIIPVMLNLFQHPKKEIPKQVRNDIVILMLIFIASALITLINPNGLKGALYPFSVFQNYGYPIEENQNIFFLWNIVHKQSILFFFIAVPALFISLILNFRRVLPVEWLMTIFFTILAAISIRNFPLFVLATFIPFAKSISNIKFSLPKHFKKAFIIFLLGLTIFEAQQVYSKKGFGLLEEKGAKAGADFFIKNNLKGPIFNNFDIGSYLNYRLYPREKVFVDGRPEAYPAAFFQNTYIPMQLDEKMFDSQDKKYNFNTIFFSHTDQTPWAEKFIKQITQNPKWNIVYLDDFVVILTKDKNIKPDIKTNYSNLQSLIQLAHFLQNTHFINEEIKVYKDILNLNPKSCPALYNLALKLQSKNDPSSPIFIEKFNQNCQ
ncbi:MAG: hypothetical protein Q7R51_02755 [bacterium]|nr:hypothetical protein [bacterium]